MNPIDETKLTAYALGELNDAERAEVEAHLANNPDAQQWVEEVRRVAGVLEQELAAPAELSLTAAQRERICEGRATPRAMRIVRIALSAAAVIVVGLALAAVIVPMLQSAGHPTTVAVGDGPQGETPPGSRGPTPTPDTESDEGEFFTHTGLAQDRGRDGDESAFAETPSPVTDETREKDPSIGYVADTGGDTATPQPTAPPATTPVRKTPVSASRTKSMPQPTMAPAGREVRARMYARRSDPAESEEIASDWAGARVVVEDASPEDDGRIRQASGEWDREAYEHVQDNPFKAVADHPLSTFSIDVDTASYANVRRMLNAGQLPPPGAVRIEEMVNYFDYSYLGPSDEDEHPFAAHVDLTDCPWNPTHHLMRVALKGREIAEDKRPAGNFVFLLDVSGSMKPANKLPLVKRAMTMLVNKLGPEDRLAIVVYAGAAGLVLDSTPCHQKDVILAALDRLGAGGSTHGSAGIRLAYEVAAKHFIEGGVNRVVLCTDGDFNVGTTSEDELVTLIENKAKSGVFLTVLGFGMGNYQDDRLESLADKGNGNYGYIDTIHEARKMLVRQMSGTLVTIAKDVKIQIEFNPANVAAYRLIGYENRILAKEDFSDDTKDAGEIGAGHTVTALYELVPPGQPVPTPSVDPLKYQPPPPPAPAEGQHGDELLTLKLRYKQPDGDTSTLMTVPVKNERAEFGQADEDFQFASAVAGFGMILRDSPHKGAATMAAVIETAQAAKGDDADGYRAEFVQLAKLAGELLPGE